MAIKTEDENHDKFTHGITLTFERYTSGRLFLEILLFYHGHPSKRSLRPDHSRQASASRQHDDPKEMNGYIEAVKSMRGRR